MDGNTTCGGREMRTGNLLASFASPAIGAALALVGAVAFAGSANATNATVTILPANGTPFTVTDTGGCGATGCVPIGATGFISGGVGSTGQAPNLLLTPGSNGIGEFRFTYLGNGDAVDISTFTVDGNTITTHTTPVGTSFTIDVTAPTDVAFTYTNTTTGQSISDSAVGPNQNLAYGLFTYTGSNASGPYQAYIGLTDLPYPGDHDFQDLGIGVAAVPEPGTWALMVLGFGALGLAGWRRQRRRLIIEEPMA
jgi:hypothetical protein